jgi:uncharacterized glyoxalase superfamily protein PhnB
MREADARRVAPWLKDVEYGRTYWAVDPEGHPWFFTTPSKAS